MNNKEKLTEATMKALQGKLTEDKVYLSDREEEVRQFFDSIDFEPFFAKIREKVGDNSIKFNKPELQKFSYDSFPVKFESEDLTDKCGVTSCLYNKIIIGNFGGGISSGKDSIDSTEETKDDLFIWMPAHFKFEYKSGGSNGTELITGVYSAKDGWKSRGE